MSVQDLLLMMNSASLNKIDPFCVCFTFSHRNGQLFFVTVKNK